MASTTSPEPDDGAQATASTVIQPGDASAQRGLSILPNPEPPMKGESSTAVLPEETDAPTEWVDSGSSENEMASAHDASDSDVPADFEEELDANTMRSLVSHRGRAASYLDISVDTLEHLILLDDGIQDIYNEVKDSGQLGEGQKNANWKTVEAELNVQLESGASRFVCATASTKRKFDGSDWLAYAITLLEAQLVKDTKGALYAKRLSSKKALQCCWIVWKMKCAIEAGDKKQKAIEMFNTRRESAKKRAQARQRREDEKLKQEQIRKAQYFSSKKKEGSKLGQITKAQTPKPKPKRTQRGGGRLNSTATSKNAQTFMDFMAKHKKVEKHWRESAKADAQRVESMTIDELMKHFDDDLQKQLDATTTTDQARIARAQRQSAELAQDLAKDPTRRAQYEEIRRHIKHFIRAFFDDFHEEVIRPDARNKALAPYGHSHEIVVDTHLHTTHENAAGAATLQADVQAQMPLSEAKVVSEQARSNRDDLNISTMDLVPATDEETREYTKWMSMLNSSAFQEDRLAEALEVCRIVDVRYKYLPHQHHNRPLRWWQVCGILWAKRVRQRNQGLGGLCADAIGTGKTLLMLGICLLEMVEATEAIEQSLLDKQPPPPARPWIVFLPPALVDQFVQFALDFSAYYQVVVLGETTFKRSQGVERINTIHNKLSYFQQDDALNARILFVVSENTYSVHAGPSALVKWKKSIDKRFQEYPGLCDRTRCPETDWPGNLEGCFAGVLIDEAQNAFRNHSSFWAMVMWLHPDYKYLFSGSPTPRGTKDLPALIAQVESPALAEKAVRGDASVQYRPTLNPYTLPDDHPAAIYRATVWCFQKYIAGDVHLTDLEKNQHAQEFLQYYLLRRDYSSACPIGSDRTISRNMKPLRSFEFERVFMPTAQQFYDQGEEPWASRRFTIKIDQNGNTDTVPNARAARALAYLAFNPLLKFLDLPNEEWVEAHAKKERMRKARADARKAKKKAATTRPDDDYEPDEDSDDDDDFDDPTEGIDRDKFSWFNDDSPIARETPRIGRGLPRIRWILAKCVEHGCKSIPSVRWQDPKEASDAEVFRAFVRFSPKIQMLLSLLNDFCIVRQEKVAIWFNYPGIHDLVHECLLFLKLDTRSVNAETGHKQREAIKSETNNLLKRFHALLAQQKIGGLGWNIQDDVRCAIIFDGSDTAAELAQIIGRLWRLGQKLEVYTFILVVPGTNDEKRIARQIAEEAQGTALLMSHTGAVDAATNPTFATASPTFLARHFAFDGKVVHIDSEEGRDALSILRERGDHDESWFPAFYPPQAALEALLRQRHKTIHNDSSTSGPMSSTELYPLVEAELFYRRTKPYADSFVAPSLRYTVAIEALGGKDPEQDNPEQDQDREDASEHGEDSVTTEEGRPTSSQRGKKRARPTADGPEPARLAYLDPVYSIWYPNQAYLDSLTPHAKGMLTKEVNKQRKEHKLTPVTSKSWPAFIKALDEADAASPPTGEPPSKRRRSPGDDDDAGRTPSEEAESRADALRGLRNLGKDYGPAPEGSLGPSDDGAPSDGSLPVDVSPLSSLPSEGDNPFDL